MSASIVLGAFRNRDLLILGEYANSTLAASAAQAAVAEGRAASAYVITTTSEFHESTIAREGGNTASHPGLNAEEIFEEQPVDPPAKPAEPATKVTPSVK